MTQNRRLEQIEPVFADVTPIRVHTKPRQNRILAFPGHRRPIGLASTAGAEIDDMDSHRNNRRASGAIHRPPIRATPIELRSFTQALDNHILQQKLWAHPRTLVPANGAIFPVSTSIWKDTPLVLSLSSRFLLQGGFPFRNGHGVAPQLGVCYSSGERLPSETPAM